jgi:AraC-like DNA-binding protein
MIQIVQQGRTESAISGQPFANPPHTIFLSNPGEVHSGVSHGAVRYCAFYVPPEIIQTIKPRGWRRCQFTHATVQDNALTDELEGVHSALSAGLNATAAFENSLRRLLERYAAPSDSQALDARVGRALDALRDLDEQAPNVEALSHRESLSRNQMTRLYVQHLGLPPKAYAINCRLEAARRWLYEDVSLADIASRFGFSDQSHFGRLFRRHFGLPPAAYRAASTRL